MKTCPNCHTAYPSRYAVCPRDASPLIDTDEWAEGTVVRHRYRILGKLGQGGMGAVYKALHTKFDQFRALKVMVRNSAEDPEFVKRFEREAVLMSKLQHPNVVRVDDIDESEDGRPFIVMEFLEGRSLREAISQEGPFPAARACAIARQAAAGLEAAHKLNMVHRDIKPENIFLVGGAEDERVKVLDFGIAKLKEERLSDHIKTSTGVVLGTAQYLSPEQAKGMRSDQLDGRSDLYSLGLVLYQMLTRDFPYHADTWTGWRTAHIQTPPLPLESPRPDLIVPEPLAGLVMRCLEKNPEARPKNARVLIQELEQVEQEIARSAQKAVAPTVKHAIGSPEEQIREVVASKSNRPLRLNSKLWEAGNTLNGKYRLLEMQDHNQYVIVFKALELKSRRLRMVESPSHIAFGRWDYPPSEEEALEQFRAYTEAFKQDALRRLNFHHHNILRVEDLDIDDDGCPFLVMEHAEGRTLQEVIRAAAPLGPLRACGIAQDLAAALTVAHVAGYVHGRVSASHTLLVQLTGSESLKLMGFGRAALEQTLLGLGLDLEMTDGMPIAPEVFKQAGSGQLDRRADVYSLGVVLYQMLTGAPPPLLKDLLAPVEPPGRSPLPPMESVRPALGLPEALTSLVMRCTNLLPDLRPANAPLVIEELTRVEESLRRKARPAEVRRKEARTPPSAPQRDVPSEVIPKVVPSDPREWPYGSVLKGRYSIMRRLSRGGVTVVYMAEDLVLHEQRVVKVFLPDLLADAAALDKLKKDLRLAAKFRHPNIVRVHDIEETDQGCPFVVLGFLEGHVLSDIIRDHAPLEVRRVCTIVRQTASALEAGHRLHLIHGDLTPGQIMLVREQEAETVKLLNYALSATASTQSADEGVLIGNPRYLCPEVVMGKRRDELDGRADLYTLGLVTYEMLTADFPFKGDTTTAMLMARLREPPTPTWKSHPEIFVPRKLAVLILKLLEKEREKRPASAGEVIRVIDEVERELK